MQTILKYLLYMHVAQHVTELLVRLFQLLTLMVTVYESLPDRMKNIITKKDFEVVQYFSIDKELLKIIKTVSVNLILDSFELYYGIWGWFWIFSKVISLAFGYSGSNELAPTIVFLVIMSAWSSVKEFPIHALDNAILGESQGTYKNREELVKQELKSLAQKLLLVPLIGAVLHISVFKYHSNLLWLALAFGLILFIGHFLYSNFIEPICLKYKPLEDGSLKTSIKNMLDESGFRNASIYVTQRPSKCTFRYVQICGYGEFKKAVLYENLMKNNLTNEEILAVVSHELGHWKKGDIWIWLAVFHEIFLADVITSILILRCGCVFKAIGLSCFYRPTILALLISKVFVSGSLTVQCLSKLMFRCFERQADGFAKSLGHGRNLANALIKIGKAKKEFPIASKIYVYSFLTQPTTLQRVDYLVSEKDN